MFRFLADHGKWLGIGLVLALSTPLAGAQGHVSVLYRFKGGADGLNPSSSVLFDREGNLYGTTSAGGGIGCGGYGCGAVYKLTQYGAETLVYSFKGAPGDGSRPSNLIRDAAGNFYGTTVYGGLQICGGDCGTVFKIAPDGTETVLHFFTGGKDGANPAAGLLIDKAGNLYGTTEQDGSRYGNGTVFKIAPDGTETVLHAFCAKRTCLDGAAPESPLIADAAGNLYGTAAYGGRGGGGGGGTVFRLGMDGTFDVLYSFCPHFGCPDGWAPQGSIVMDAAGNIYGATNEGGLASCNRPYGCGTVFEVDANGKETVLHAFDATVDGQNPRSGVIMDSAGYLYGTVGQAGTGSCEDKLGVVFRLAPDGSEKQYCISSPLGGGVIEKGSSLYGAATGAGRYDDTAGFVFSVRK